MEVMIHACPPRMWYVERFLAPSLRVQGIEPLIFCGTERRGNLGAFPASIRELHGDGTWHIQAEGADPAACAGSAGRRGREQPGGLRSFYCQLPELCSGKWHPQVPPYSRVQTRCVIAARSPLRGSILPYEALCDGRFCALLRVAGRKKHRGRGG